MLTIHSRTLTLLSLAVAGAFTGIFAESYDVNIIYVRSGDPDIDNSYMGDYTNESHLGYLAGFYEGYTDGDLNFNIYAVDNPDEAIQAASEFADGGEFWNFVVIHGVDDGDFSKDTVSWTDGSGDAWNLGLNDSTSILESFYCYRDNGGVIYTSDIFNGILYDHLSYVFE